MVDYENNEEIKLFREYLRIPTVHPNVDYEPCIQFLKKIACNLGIEGRVYRPTNKKKPFLIITWYGSNLKLKSILLHSHMDVVPVYEEYWTHPPFAANIDFDGRIYGRGTQDMKCVGMQYIEALRKLKQEGFIPKRTIHVTFGSDEELGGAEGMRIFVESTVFKDMNVGFALDEGMATPDETIPVFFAERTVRRIQIKITGNPGHGSLLLEKTAGVKFQYILNKLTAFRQSQYDVLKTSPGRTIGDVTTVNLTQISGGVQSNVIPAQLIANFDIRFDLETDMDEFELQLNKWCNDAGGGIEIHYEAKHNRVPPTDISNTNIFWNSFKSSIDKMHLKTKLQVFPGGTDSRYIRAKNIPAIGFSPINFTPILLHDHDEFIKATTYLNEPCTTFFERMAKEMGLPIRVIAPSTPKKPILLLTWEGTNKSLPSILLNSHTDVVPVFEEFWTHPPFSAEMNDDGKIFARGAQDMKCVGMQYIAAIRQLKKSGFLPKRTINLSFVPDEEVGGLDGMAKFVETKEFEELNIGFSLDEGIASPTDVYPVFFAERAIWHVWFKINGNPGHGSLLLENTAGVKANYLISKLTEYREQEVVKLRENPDLVNADVTTVNLTMLKGGVQSNVIPPQLTVVFDIRLAIDVDHIAFESQLKKWCEEAGGGIDVDYEMKEPPVKPTSTDSSNPYWTAFVNATNEMGLQIIKQVFPGGTDSRYIRAKNIPAIGFSPMNNTPVLLHDHDEFIGAETYLKGIEIYKTIIRNLANI